MVIPLLDHHSPHEILILRLSRLSPFSDTKNSCRQAAPKGKTQQQQHSEGHLQRCQSALIRKRCDGQLIGHLSAKLDGIGSIGPPKTG